MDNNKHTSTKYDISGLAVCVPMGLISYFAIDMGYVAFAAFIISTLYWVLSIHFKKGTFTDEHVQVFYPLRILNRRKTIKYADITSVYRSFGSYLDTTSLIIKYNSKSSKRKVVLLYPSEESEKQIEELLHSANLSITKPVL